MIQNVSYIMLKIGKLNCFPGNTDQEDMGKANEEGRIERKQTDL